MSAAAVNRRLVEAGDALARCSIYGLSFWLVAMPLACWFGVRQD
jgi:hypothetical protein